MSWIFHEPLEPAIYARRTVGPPVQPAIRAFSQHGRAVESLTAADVWREETEGWVSQRRAFSPLAARRAFSRARSVSALDLWRDEDQPAQRRAYAHLRVVSVTRAALNPARRLLPALLASGVYDDYIPAQRPTRFAVGHAQPGTDIGLSASFTFSGSGTTADATLSFTGAGDDPTQPSGLQALPLEGLQALPLEVVQVTPGSDSYAGQSASKIV